MIDERKDKLGEQSEEQVNIQELLFRYLIHWPWFVVSIIICIACAWGYLRLTTPIYNISATVLIKDERNVIMNVPLSREREVGLFLNLPMNSSIKLLL